VYHVRFYPPRGSRTIIHVLTMHTALRVKHNMGDIVASSAIASVERSVRCS